MKMLRSGPVPLPGSMRVSCARCAGLVVAAVLLGGCSQTTHTSTAHDPRVATPPYHVAAESGRKVDLEDDGREAQIPPMKKAHPEPDDPREPWSPNYGRQGPVHRAEAVPARAAAVAASTEAGDLGPIVRGPVPGDLPPAFRRRLASAMDE